MNVYYILWCILSNLYLYELNIVCRICEPDNVERIVLSMKFIPAKSWCSSLELYVILSGRIWHILIQEIMSNIETKLKTALLNRMPPRINWWLCVIFQFKCRDRSAQRANKDYMKALFGIYLQRPEIAFDTEVCLEPVYKDLKLPLTPKLLGKYDFWIHFYFIRFWRFTTKGTKYFLSFI